MEGKEIFGGRVDVVVTDGFSGNVLLKTSEAVAKLLVDVLKALIARDVFVLCGEDRPHDVAKLPDLMITHGHLRPVQRSILRTRALARILLAFIRKGQGCSRASAPVLPYSV